MDVVVAFRHLGIAFGLGLLVGLQRAHANSGLAGVRTFPLITVLGVVCGMLAATVGGWVLAAGFLSLAAMIVVGNIALLIQGVADPGLTTEIVILLMFGVGAILVSGSDAAAIAVGGGVAALRQFKGAMHGFAARLGDEDLRRSCSSHCCPWLSCPCCPTAPLDRTRCGTPARSGGWSYSS